jgi:hypothetical protein
MTEQEKLEQAIATTSESAETLETEDGEWVEISVGRRSGMS